MIVLTTFPSQNKFNYRTKSEALADIKANGLRYYQYSLKDTTNNTKYYKGIWITKSEEVKIRNGASVKTIKVLRKHRRR